MMSSSRHASDTAREFQQGPSGADERVFGRVASTSSGQSSAEAVRQGSGDGVEWSIMSVDPEMLTSLSVAELGALAEGLLVPARQARLDDLLANNGEGLLSVQERRELDRLLELVDQLTLLKTRARYTLGQLKVEAAGS